MSEREREQSPFSKVLSPEEYDIYFLHLMPTKFSNIFRNQVATIRGDQTFYNVVSEFARAIHIDMAVSDWMFDSQFSSVGGLFATTGRGIKKK